MSRDQLVVEWNRSEVRVWRLSLHHGRWSVSDTATQPIAASTDRGTGSISDDLTANGTVPNDIAVALRACVGQLKASRLPVWGIFPGRETNVRRIPFPPKVQASQLDALMPHELPRHVGIEPSLLIYDHAILSSTPDITQVLVTATRRNRFESYQQVCQQAGVRLEGIVPSMLAFASSVLAHPASQGSQREGVWCAIQQRSTSTDVVLFEGRHPVLARTFELPQATEMQRHTTFLREVQATLQQYLRTHALEQIGVGLFFHTEETPIDGLESLPLQQVEQHSLSHPLFQCVSDSILNLRSPQLREERQHRQAFLGQLLRGALPGVASLLLLALLSGLWQSNHSLQAEVDISESQQEHQKTLGKELRTLQKQLQSLEAQRTVFRWVQERYPTLTERLLSATASLPDTIWLESVSIPEEARSRKARQQQPLPVSQLVVKGYAAHQSDIHTFTQALSQTELFDTVVQHSSEPKTLRGEAWLEFVLVLSSRPLGEGLRWEGAE